MASVDYCFISSDVFYVCEHHALSTEVEEVMGLLIGYTDQKQKHCHITHNLLLKRLDKRKDRVEISPESLASSITECDRLNATRKNAQNGQENGVVCVKEEEEPELRVVGWYHSHPHITVFPSEVDLRTQEQYQTGADPMWIGLIFGVYNAEESTGAQKFQYIAFQSLYKGGGGLVQALIPVIVKPKIGRLVTPNHLALENVAKALEMLLTEEFEAYAKRATDLDASLPSNDCLTPLQCVSVFSKNVCKIVRLLATPSFEVLQNGTRHNLNLASIRRVLKNGIGSPVNNSVL